MERMQTLLKKIFLTASCDEKTKKLLFDKLYYDTFQRTFILSLIFGVAFTTYGFNIVGYLRRYIPSLTLWDNVWPRFVFNSLPLLFITYFLTKTKKFSYFTKSVIWIISFCAIFHIACWIYIWPIALSGNSEVLAIVNVANIFLIAVLYAILSPPPKLQGVLLISLLIFFCIPFSYIAYHSGDKIILAVVMLDVIQGLFLGILISLMINFVRTKLAIYEIQKQQQTELFLGPTVSKAIFEMRPELLSTRKVSGFFVSLDIRGYTALVKNVSKEKASMIMTEYHKLVSEVISSKGGFIHKTIGDGHLISFGAMDEKVDLSVIPDLEYEEKNAELRRQKYIFSKLFSALNEIINGLYFICQSTNSTPLLIGAGVTCGEAEIKLFGDEKHRKELDLFGEVIIESARLQSYSKYLKNVLNLENFSLLVISPKVEPFITDGIYLERITTQNNPIRDFSNIDFVYTFSIPFKFNSNIESYAA